MQARLNRPSFLLPSSVPLLPFAHSLSACHSVCGHVLVHVCMSSNIVSVAPEFSCAYSPFSSDNQHGGSHYAQAESRVRNVGRGPRLGARSRACEGAVLLHLLLVYGPDVFHSYFSLSLYFVGHLDIGSFKVCAQSVELNNPAQFTAECLANFRQACSKQSVTFMWWLTAFTKCRDPSPSCAGGRVFTRTYLQYTKNIH